MQCCINENLTGKAENVIRRLRRTDATVVTAESCTGGLVAACLTHGKEASSCFQGSFVVYTKQQKHRALGVDEELLREQGAVNSEVAIQLAEGALRQSQASLSLAVTGILGPDPDEDGNQPGIVYLALARTGAPTEVVRHDFSPSPPDSVREQTVLAALDLLERGADAL
jgi:nicotinamide-nucleotide amidase